MNRAEKHRARLSKRFQNMGEFVGAMVLLHTNTEARFIDEIGAIFPKESEKLHRTIFLAISTFAKENNLDIKEVLPFLHRATYSKELLEVLKSRPPEQYDSLIQERLLQMFSVENLAPTMKMPGTPRRLG